MAERFYNDFETYPDYDNMGVGEDALKGLYPDKDVRDQFMQIVRGMFTGGHVSYEEAGDLLRMGEGEGRMTDEGSGTFLGGDNIWAGLKNVKETSVEERQAARALSAAAIAGAQA